MPTIPERLAVLETQGKEHEGRHSRFEDRMERFATSVEERLDGISRHVAGIEAKIEKNGVHGNGNKPSGVKDSVRSYSPWVIGGGGGSLGIVELLKQFLGG